MKEADIAERCDELAQAILEPLVLGGPVHPVRPFGGPLALRLGLGKDGAVRRVADADLGSRLDVARVRRARLIAPVDTLPELDAGDWAVLAGLNDLLQLTNHELAGALTRGRYARLVLNLRWLCERIPAPRDLLGALSRHATFARALDMVRTDSAVSWWTGSARFRGERPPSRLTAWPEIRRVRVDEQRVSLADMPLGLIGITIDDFTDVLGLWLTRSPLTDLATVTRKSPVFAWSASTLSIIATGAGRGLAFRALARQPGEAAVAALGRAAKAVPEHFDEARGLAERFASEVAEGRKAQGELGGERG